jgi:hypothetical protein
MMLTNISQVLKGALIGGAAAFALAFVGMLLFATVIGVTTEGFVSLMFGIANATVYSGIFLVYAVPAGLVVGAWWAAIHLWRRANRDGALRVRFIELAVPIVLITPVAALPTLNVDVVSERELTATVIDIAYDNIPNVRDVRYAACDTALVALKLDEFNLLEQVCSGELADHLGTAGRQVTLRYEMRGNYGRRASVRLTHVGDYEVEQSDYLGSRTGCGGMVYAPCNSDEALQMFPFR